jgi:hypothetical protein
LPERRLQGRLLSLSSLVQDSLGNVFGTTNPPDGFGCNGADSCVTAFELKH